MPRAFLTINGHEHDYSYNYLEKNSVIFYNKFSYFRCSSPGNASIDIRKSIYWKIWWFTEVSEF